MRSTAVLARRTLRLLGTAALAASLAGCLLADPPAMAVPSWVMTLAATVPVVASILAWRPR